MCVLFHVVAVKEDLFKFAVGVHQSLIEKVGRIPMAALAASQQGFCADARPELDSTHKTIAVYPVATTGAGKIFGFVAGQCSPQGAGKGNGQ